MSLYDLKGRNLLWLVDYTPEEVRGIIEVGLEFKRRYYSGERVIRVLDGRSIAMIFEKPSTRTRISFDLAAVQLGAHPIYLSWNELQLGRGETIGDTARVLSRYVDGVVARVKRHEVLEEFAKYASIPVINGLSNLTHPAQALGDYMTILEKKGRLEGVKLAFIGDGGDNVLHSLLIAGAKLGVSIRIASPKRYRPNPIILEEALKAARDTGAEIMIVEDPFEAVRDVDIIYTDVWVSMGQESESEERVKELSRYQVNRRLIEEAGNPLFMHCLPAMRGQEVTDEVIDGPWSIVWDQAENRLHIQKAILSLLIP